MIMMKKTKTTINKRIFEITYQKKETKEGIFFEGKIFFSNNAISFSFLKRNNMITSFKPELNEKNAKQIIAAIEQKEREVWLFFHCSITFKGVYPGFIFNLQHPVVLPLLVLT